MIMILYCTVQRSLAHCAPRNPGPPAVAQPALPWPHCARVPVPPATLLALQPAALPTAQPAAPWLYQPQPATNLYRLPPLLPFSLPRNKCGHIIWVPSLVFDLHNVAKLPSIESIFVAGLCSHVSFTFLTNKGVVAHANNMFTHITNAGKAELKFSQWDKVCWYFLLIIAKHIPDNLAAWKKHFKALTHQSNSTSKNWLIYCNYNIAIWTGAVGLLCNPGKWHKDLIQEICIAHITAAAWVAIKAAGQCTLAGGPACTTHTAAPASNGQSSKGSIVSSSSTCPAAAPAGPAKPSGFCFWCGSRNTHAARNCSKTTAHSGNVPLLNSSTSPKPNSNASGAWYCIAHNTQSSCKFGTASWKCTYTHTCTLCGLSTHIAPSCPRTKPFIATSAGSS
jgi:hypothetical protein